MSSTSGARTQLKQLAARELLTFSSDAIAFHDLQRAFLLLRAGDVRLLHADLLATYRAPRGSDEWAELPPDEPYIWEHLLYHLRGAGDGAQAQVDFGSTGLKWLMLRYAPVQKL